MANVAKDVIIPKDSGIFRVIFLYVGQGDSTLLVVPDGTAYKYVLIDSNTDTSAKVIDLLRMLKDLFRDSEDKLEVYINTHPHKDHLDEVKQIYKEIGMRQLWHSGHKPGGEHKDVYEDLEYVMKELGEKNVFRLLGSRSENKLDETTVKLGDIDFNVLGPAEYVSEDIQNEKPEDRYRRIHEQCGVIRFKYGKEEKQVLITGDADYTAWKEHITDYHKDRLPSIVLSAAHHGSNSFFWKGTDTKEDPYKAHLKSIKPTYIVVSAPTRKESRHGHPDKEAMDLYEEEVGEDNVFHLGKKRESVIVDITSAGEIYLYPDDELVKEYGVKDDEDGDKGGKKTITSSVVSRIDNKPFG
jgi:competence protein ComEC